MQLRSRWTGAARIVPPGTRVGTLRGELAELPTLRGRGADRTGVPRYGVGDCGDPGAWETTGRTSARGRGRWWGRCSIGRCNDPGAAGENFTNLRAVGGRICFHKNVNGMWLIRQCIEAWSAAGRMWTVPELVMAAEGMGAPRELLEVDEDDLLLAGAMPERINAQRKERGYAPLDESPENAPEFASLIFHSLAARYAEVLGRVEAHSGKRFKRLFIVGGASQNEFLNRLTARATGFEVVRGAAESSTVGNFAVQLACLEATGETDAGVSADEVSAWAGVLVAALDREGR